MLLEKVVYPDIALLSSSIVLLKKQKKKKKRHPPENKTKKHGTLPALDTELTMNYVYQSHTRTYVRPHTLIF